MYFGTRVAPVDDAAGIPEGPSCRCCCAGYTCGICFEKVELVCRVLVHAATDEGEKGDEKSSTDEYERDECEGRSWDGLETYFG